MTELELAQHTADVTRWVAYFGFALWGVAGWYVGRFFLKRNYIKPTGLINMKLMRQIERDNFDKNGEITELKGQIKHFEAENNIILDANKALELQNKSLWYWNYQPHREAEFITIKQLDKKGEVVATSQIMLPDSKDWAYQPVAFADDTAEDFYQWKEERHQSEANHL
jgi:hypothetical protein